MPDGFSVDARDLDELVLKLRVAADRSRLEVDKSLAAIGEAHKEKAKAALDGHSTSIPPTIRSEPLPGAVRVTAAGTALAWAYERGNKDNRRGKTFTHPVFGEDRGDMGQPRYPFFKTARRQLRLWTIRTLTDAWKRAMRHSGLKVE